MYNDKNNQVLLQEKFGVDSQTFTTHSVTFKSLDKGNF